MEITQVVSLVVEIVEFCIPFTLVFGFTAKLLNFAFDMIFDRKISMQEVVL